ncbi:MAG: AAA family ATPase [Alphaproteobacteria bacterium]
MNSISVLSSEHRTVTRSLMFPAVVASTGLSGSGKSHVAGAIADASGFDLLSSDELRKLRAGLDPAKPAPAGDRESLYAPSARREIYRLIADETRARLETGRSVVLDATFNDEAGRARVAQAAGEAGGALLFVECRLGDEQARARLAARAIAPGAGARSDADFAVRLAQARERDPLSADEPHVVVDTSGAPGETAAAAVGAALRTLAGAATGG